MNDIANRIRDYLSVRGGPAKDDDGKYIGTGWPMMLEAVSEIDRLHGALNEIAVMPNEDNEWDAVDKYDEVRKLAQSAVSHTDERGRGGACE